MLVVYGMPGTRSFRVTWALEEAGADYEYRLVDLRKGEGRGPAYLSVNPEGKVPSLVDGDVVVTESLAICLYIAEKFPAARLAPAIGSPARSAFLRWSAFVACELEQPLWTLSKHKFALPKERRVPDIRDTARWEFKRAATLLAQWLDQSAYLAGDAFSAADILAGHTLRWARNTLDTLPDPRLEEYADQILERPAAARAGQREQAA